MNVKTIMVLLVAIFVCTSYDDQDEHKDLKEVIDLIYSEGNPYRHDTVLNKNCSEKLKALLLQAKEVERLAVEEIPEKDRNQIKPCCLIEGEIFASVDEGYQSYAIKEVIPQENHTVVELEFTFNLFGPKEVWTDKLILVHENGWKLDNVIYTEKYSSDLQELLSDFIQEYKATHKAAEK